MMKPDEPERISIPNYEIRAVSVSRLGDLQKSIEIQNAQGLLDPEFFEELLSSFEYQPPDMFPEARSIFIVALRDPVVAFTFHWRGEVIRALAPPTYIFHNEKALRAIEVIKDYFGENNVKLSKANVPRKLLAVCSGLGDYGRNNLVYVAGMGSYLRLMAFYSDYEPVHDDWREPRMMAACERCESCLRNCPTKTITRDHFLIKAERCLTFWNEKPREIAFPDWVKKEWHNCLIGCMRCQAICPENKNFWEYVEEGCHFFDDETRQIASKIPLENLNSSLLAKLEQWDLTYLYEYIPRNLSSLLQRDF